MALNCKEIAALLMRDEYIGGIIDIGINSRMSVSTLYALETIFYLRLQLTQMSWDANETLYEEICRDRFEQISKALIEKYRNSKSINEKLAAYWNNSPSMRPALTETANKTASIDGLSLPEKRVNQIAAEIYARIEALTGKYKVLDSLTA